MLSRRPNDDDFPLESDGVPSRTTPFEGVALGLSIILAAFAAVALAAWWAFS